jgi:hypothetical protein
MVFIFVIAIAVLSVSLGFLLNGAWSAVFTTVDVPEPPDNPRDLEDPEQRREFERRYPPTKRLWFSIVADTVPAPLAAWCPAAFA